ncbi:transporter substrate-binding domain-containing protein [Shewanella sp. A3A]|nr:transporter substrate-binding domain-containing protein [Shewanella ferrihydritica]
MARKVCLWCVWLMCFSAVAEPNASPDPINLYFTGRPPFIWRDDAGQMHGISYEIGEQVFQRAQIPYQWIKAPSARVNHYFITDKQRLCLVNWIYTDERQKLGRISLPTYQEQDYVGVVPKEKADKYRGREVAAVLDDPTTIVLFKEGYAYSTVLTKLLINMKAPKVDYRGTQTHNLRLIAEKRADIAFFEQQELALILKQQPDLVDKVAVVNFPGLNTEPTTRHVICSKSVTEQEMQKINLAIEALHLTRIPQSN